MSDYTDGWRISGVQVEEQGSWKNTISIDLECDEQTRKKLDGKQWVSGMVYLTGLSKYPTQVGWFSFRADRAFDDEDDRDLEININDTFLNWGDNYEVHFTVRDGYDRTRHQLNFQLTQDIKVTDFPPIVDLEIASEVRPAKWRRVPEIAGKVKVRFKYDFQNEDAWFRVHHSNVTLSWWERICRWNDRGRCAVWVPLKTGRNTIQITPYDPGSGATGKIAEITVENPHGTG